MFLSHGYFRDIPNKVQLFDYGARVDGQPEYIGHALYGSAEASEVWVIFKFTYNGSNQVTKIESLGDREKWSLRAVIFV